MNFPFKIEQSLDPETENSKKFYGSVPSARPVVSQPTRAAGN
jgi:hypothetical protein